MSPRATPMLATVERIDPWVRQPDHIVVTTQASANTGWPTVDSRDMSTMFPREVNKSNGADASQVLRTRTRVIGKAVAKNAAADPISRAIVRSASVIDVQRRQDVGGDADALAEALDVAWALPLGTFSCLAPLVLASSQDLLRTAISSDHNAPDALMAVQRKRVIHVAGGTIGRDAYGTHAAMDWARQRAIARSIFNLSTQLEGMDLLPTTRTWAAADIQAPMHSSARDKHLVFQPAYGSALIVDPASFKFTMPLDVPPRFERCTGNNTPNTVLTEAELCVTLDAMVAAGLPRVAAETVRETFRMNKITRLVMGNDSGSRVKVRGADAGALHKASSASLAIAHREVTTLLTIRLARGAKPGNVLRSRIYDVMQSVDAAELVPVFRLIAVLKQEAIRYGIPKSCYGLVRQLAARLSHTLGALVVMSLALEAERVGADLDEWLALANEVIPKPLRVEENTALGWATIAVWNLWSETTGKWAGALKSASHATMVKMASATMAPQFVTTTLVTVDPMFEAATAALAGCKKYYASYYENMYDYYALLARNSPELIPLGVGNTVMPFRVSMDRYRTSCAAYLGALLWQFRGRHLRSAYLKKIPVGSPNEPGLESRINCYDYEIAIMVAPNKAYESMRQVYNKVATDKMDQVLRPGVRGDVREIIARLPCPAIPGAEDMCNRGFLRTRLGRYISRPERWVDDLRKTYDEVAREVAFAALGAGAAHIAPNEGMTETAMMTARMAEETVGARLTPVLLVAGPAAVIQVSSGFAGAAAVVASKLTGWKWIKDVYGSGMTEMITDLEEVASEEAVEELLNSEYDTKEEFIAALDAMYGYIDGPSAATGDDGMTHALNY